MLNLRIHHKARCFIYNRFLYPLDLSNFESLTIKTIPGYFESQPVVILSELLELDNLSPIVLSSIDDKFTHAV